MIVLAINTSSPCVLSNSDHVIKCNNNENDEITCSAFLEKQKSTLKPFAAQMLEKTHWGTFITVTVALSHHKLKQE